jgi:oligogalacturonide lyase
MWSRRAFLSALPAIARPQSVASELTRYRDPATEFELTRLTDPALSSCYLPHPPRRAVTRRNNSLLYCSDRTGSLQAYLMDLKNGESRQLTNAASLDRSAISLMADDRTVCFCDGESLEIAGGRSRKLYVTEPGWSRGEAFTVAEDGNHVVVSEHRTGTYRLQLVTVGRQAVTTVAQSDAPIRFAATRPKRAGILYGREDGLWLVNYDGGQNRKLRVGQGTTISALWSGDGRSVLYILNPGSGKPHELRECIPDSNQDKLVAATTQFVSFSRNADASVFVGVSGSKASPYILLLLRVARREFTVAEHRATNATGVAVQFSPNSQRLFFQTDRQGKPAIYTMALDRFIDETEISNAAYWTQPGAAFRGKGERIAG